MKKKIHYAIRPFHNNHFPSEFKIGELEQILQQSYSTRGRMVVPEYFVEGSCYYPENPSFLVIPYYGWVNQLGRGKVKVGEVIVTNEKIKVFVNDKQEDFEFGYIDKFGIVPKYQENGIGNRTLNVTVKLIAKPTILRTSDVESHKWYSKRSDINGTVLEKSGLFYTHGFGFLDKNSGEELFGGARGKFTQASISVAIKPMTVVPIGSFIGVDYSK